MVPLLDGAVKEGRFIGVFTHAKFILAVSARAAKKSAKDTENVSFILNMSCGNGKLMSQIFGFLKILTDRFSAFFDILQLHPKM